jgi:hypothetical protein
MVRTVGGGCLTVAHGRTPSNIRAWTGASWERVYRAKAPTEVSWYQAEPRLSLDLILRSAPDRNIPIIDVGGGASTLVDGLLDAGYTAITVLDVAPAAIAAA